MNKTLTDVKGAHAKVRKELDIVKVVSDDLGAPTKVTGHDSLWQCPFHSESSPSFGVHSQLQIYKCFGCTKGGDVVSWTQNFYGLSWPEAVYLLAVKYGVDISVYERAPTEEELTKARYIDICDKAAKFCCTQLFQNKTMLDWYKIDTGFTIDQIADHEVGWTQSVDTLVRHLFSIIPNLTQDDVDKLEFTNKLMWNNSLVYPVKDPSGKTLRFYNKPLAPPPDFGGKYVGTSHKHPLFTNKLLYGFHLVRRELRGSRYSIRCVEGQKAAIASGGVAMMGSSLHEEQIRLLQEHQIKEVIVAFDGDAAGRAASVRLLDDMALMDNINVLVARLPDDTQPDDIVKSLGKPALDLIFTNSVLPIQFFVDTKRDSSGLIPTKDRFSLIQELRAFLISIPELHLDLAAKYLSDELSVDVLSIKSFVTELKLTKSGLLNKESELSVIRHVMLNPRAWSIVRQAIIDPKAFTIGAYQYVFGAMDACHIKARNLSGADSVTVQAIRDEMSIMFSQFKELPQIIDTILTAEPKYEFMDALNRTVDLYRRRTGIEQSRVFQAMMQDLGKQTGEMLSKFRRELVSGLEIRKDDVSTPVLLAEAVQAEMRARQANTSEIIGYDFSRLVDVDGQVIPCLTGLTYALSGLQKQHQVVLSANSGVGKSLLALQMAVSLSICPKPADQIPVLWIPLEMNEMEITMRIISMLTGIDNNKVQRAKFSSDENLRYLKAMDMIAMSQFHIKKPRTGTIDEIFSIYDEFCFKYGIKVGFLDYIQLISAGPADKGSSREETIGRASKMLKGPIAENMRITSVAIAQLNKADFKAGEVRKQENIGGSYQISQDADDLATITEKTEQQIQEERGMKGNRKIFLDKRRGGASDIMIDLELDCVRTMSLRYIECISPGQMMGLKK